MGAAKPHSASGLSIPAQGAGWQLVSLTFAGGNGWWVLAQGVTWLLAGDAQDAAQRGAAAAPTGWDRGDPWGAAHRDTGWKGSSTCYM